MIEYHKTLNPKLWINNKLIPEVKNKLIEIYQTFINKLKENEIPIEVIDVLLLGSNASYNYTDNSDIDLHIVTDFENLGLNNTLAQIFYNNEKSKFNDDYDISIKGLPVEVYIEDINAGTKSNGVYSLLQDKWLKFPEYNPPKNIDYSFLLNVYQNKVNNALQGNSEQIKKIINEIKMLRKLSLMDGGEYSKGNLVFKELRNNGSIDNLYNKLHELTSKELSLEKLNNLKEYVCDNCKYDDPAMYSTKCPNCDKSHDPETIEDPNSSYALIKNDKTRMLGLADYNYSKTKSPSISANIIYIFKKYYDHLINKYNIHKDDVPNYAKAGAIKYDDLTEHDKELIGIK